MSFAITLHCNRYGDKGYIMLRVLVIDDDQGIRLLTRRMLTTLGCESFEAANGIEGESKVTELKPDLVLLDIMMPIQDGYETCEKIRAQGYVGPIIMISSLQEEREKSRTQEAGANAYIQKPLARDVVALHIKHAEVGRTA